MTVLTWIICFAAGFLSSLGTGGGMLLMIWLTAVMGTAQLDAQGINLVFFIPVALVSVIIHWKNGLIDMRKMLPAMLTGTVGAVIGAAAAHFIGSENLRKLYAVFIIIVGIKTLAEIVKTKYRNEH